MKTKILGLLVTAIAFAIGWYGSRAAIDYFRKEPAVANDILERPWVEQSMDNIAFDAPWLLEPKGVELPADVARLVTSSTAFSHEADGLSVMAMHMTFLPGTPTSLEGAADGAISNLKTAPGIASVDGKKSAFSILGDSGYQIEASLKRTSGPPLYLRGVVFGRGPELYQLILICREDQPLGGAVWEKLRGGIRRRNV